jgi:hypothetical protein
MPSRHRWSMATGSAIAGELPRLLAGGQSNARSRSIVPINRSRHDPDDDALRESNPLRGIPTETRKDADLPSSSATSARSSSVKSSASPSSFWSPASTGRRTPTPKALGSWRSSVARGASSPTPRVARTGPRFGLRSSRSSGGREAGPGRARGEAPPQMTGCDPPPPSYSNAGLMLIPWWAALMTHR